VLTVRSILDLSLPAMSPHSSGTRTFGAPNPAHTDVHRLDPPRPFKHAKAEDPTDNRRKEVSRLLSRDKTTSIWSLVMDDDKKMLPDWHTESDIVTYIQLCLKDIAASLAGVLPKSVWREITFAKELSVFGDRGDIWVLARSGIPVGVVEVKKPGKGIMDHPFVAGQIYDYMMRLRSFYGLDNVFGIVSTYREWRVFWLEDTQPAAESDKVSVPPFVENPVDRLLPHVPPFALSPPKQSKKASVATASTRPRVYADRTVAWNDPEIILLLASVLLKMVCSPATRLTSLLAKERVAITVNRTHWLWTPLPADFQLNFSPTGVPKFNLKLPLFYLLLHLGDGEFGRAWLAATSAGDCCVLKFPKNTDAEDRDKAKEVFDRELAAWREVWGKHMASEVTLYNDKRALVMPYVKVCKKDVIPTDDVKAAARAAIDAMVSKGRCHDDLRWDHVGLYTDVGGTLAALLIDLGLVKTVKKGQEDKARREMLKKLAL